MHHFLNAIKDYFGQKSWVLLIILTTIEYANCHQNFLWTTNGLKYRQIFWIYDNLETKFENMAIVWPSLNA